MATACVDGSWRTIGPVVYGIVQDGAQSTMCFSVKAGTVRRPDVFVATKLLRSVPPLIVWLALAGLEMTHLHTGWTVPDEFCARFVYFFTGIFPAADSTAREQVRQAVASAVWQETSRVVAER